MTNENVFPLTNTILDGVETLAILLFVLLMHIQGLLKFLPLSLRISLIMFFLYSVCFDVAHV